MKLSSFQRKWAGVTLLVLVVWLLGGWVVDRALTRVEVSDLYAWQAAGGGAVPVKVVKRTHGFFISGGHGWSLGSTQREYELKCVHEGRTLRWQGPGMPIALQRLGDAFYLATFDREGRLPEWGFRCYVWEGGAWQDLPVKLFPRSLARLNLMSLGADYVVSMTEPAFRTSLLAHFWFSIDSGAPYRVVEQTTVTEEFVKRFAKSMKSPLSAP